MFGEKVVVEYESEDSLQERAAANVGNVFSWTSGAAVGRDLRLLNGKPITKCRECGTQIVLDIPWSIDAMGNVVIVRKFAQVTRADNSARVEVEPFLCRKDFEKQAARIVTPRAIPPSTEKPQVWHSDAGPHGRLHGIGPDAAAAYESMTKEHRRQVAMDAFVRTAVKCEEV